MTVAKRGALSTVAAILVHVTVIRATTGMPRPFNDFYPLANVPHVRTCEILRVYACACMCVCVYRPPRPPAPHLLLSLPLAYM